MFEFIPFSGITYWLNFSAHMAVSSGALMGDVQRAMAPYLAHVEANRPMFERAKQVAPLAFDGKPTAQVPEDLAQAMFEAAPIWCAGWRAEGERLASDAASFEAAGRSLTAGDVYRRASVLISMAEWSMLLSPEKRQTFDRGRELCLRAIDLLGERFEHVVLPYREKELDGMFWPAPGEGRKPTAVVFNGLHSSMEWFWQVGLIRELHRRGISALTFDCPGSGTARFHKEIHMEPETERYARPAMDYVLTRPDVDPERVAAVGCSFGGYRTVRAAATDQRYKTCLAWGALYGMALPPGASQQAGSGSSSANGLDARTLLWFMGAASPEAWIEKRQRFTLAGVIEDLACDLLVFHGGADMQVPVAQAHKVIAGATGARSKELHIYTEREGGAQHCHLDNPGTPLGHMTDRLAELLARSDYGDAISIAE
jgi:fermentation-respiration switch protein FrsA (DUF1100 family)